METGFKKYNIALVGATGAVGKVFLDVLEQRGFPVNTFKPLASARSAGKRIEYMGQEVEVGELKKDSFEDIDIAFFSAGGGISKQFAPYAADSGAVVIDNSSAFRMEKGIPLVVPEVNREHIFTHEGIIANPNCSTIIMAVAIKPIYELSRIKRIVVSTYQAVSGAGARAIDELQQQVRALVCEKKAQVECEVFPLQIAFNVIPHIDIFLDNGYTKEEMKMAEETQKIFGDSSIKVTATAVRVPVFTSHSESIHIETEKKITLNQARSALSKGKGLSLKDDFREAVYPTVLDSSGKDAVFIGRVREDISTANGISMWVVGDQLRKGAALNAVQIAEELIRG